MRGRIAHSVNSYEKINAQWSHINILKGGYTPSWISKAPMQRAAAGNHTITALASKIPDTEL